MRWKDMCFTFFEVLFKLLSCVAFAIFVMQLVNVFL